MLIVTGSSFPTCIPLISSSKSNLVSFIRSSSFLLNIIIYLSRSILAITTSRSLNHKCIFLSIIARSIGTLTSSIDAVISSILSIHKYPNIVLSSLSLILRFCLCVMSIKYIPTYDLFSWLHLSNFSVTNSYTLSLTLIIFSND